MRKVSVTWSCRKHALNLFFVPIEKRENIFAPTTAILIFKLIRHSLSPPVYNRKIFGIDNTTLVIDYLRTWLVFIVHVLNVAKLIIASKQTDEIILLELTNIY